MSARVNSFASARAFYVQSAQKTAAIRKDCGGFHGGEKGIRTLVGGLLQTRFPVVRLRPAQPSLRADNPVSVSRVAQTGDLLILPHIAGFVKRFLKNNREEGGILRGGGLPPRSQLTLWFAVPEGAPVPGVAVLPCHCAVFLPHLPDPLPRQGRGKP